MNSPFNLNESQALEAARTAVASKISPVPMDDVDLAETGALDSMAWVDTLISIESATGIRDFGNPWPEDRPKSIRVLADMIREADKSFAVEGPSALAKEQTPGEGNVTAAGWGYALGSRAVTAEQIEDDLALPRHKIRDGAGIHSVCLAGEGEDELVLGQKAAETALEIAEVPVERINFLVATSSTFLGFPSFAASLHSRLLLPENSGALDVGGACAGLIFSLSVAKSLLGTTSNRVALVVASEVYSRKLCGPQVPREFRGLLGDGACAFVLTNEGATLQGKLSLRDFVWGCSGTFASSLRVKISENAGLGVEFRGEQLAQAAVCQLDRIIGLLEKLSARQRAEVDSFALHQPNPRVVEILAERARIPLERVPMISRTRGNLGSVTCGISLCQTLTAFRKNGESGNRPLIFMAGVAPGLVWGGTYWS
jgi:3-oxoacyl-[acyl-carrier-protein] synthase-3